MAMESEEITLNVQLCLLRPREDGLHELRGRDTLSRGERQVRPDVATVYRNLAPVMTYGTDAHTSGCFKIGESNAEHFDRKPRDRSQGVGST